jgi:multidrug efflux pump subunit AcrA (membrane-fusion protein)
MHAKAKFTFDANRTGLTLPRKVIAGSLQDPKIYIVQGDSMAVLRAITLGGIYGDKVEVTSGVLQGDKIVLTGQLNLVDGAKVSVVR